MDMLTADIEDSLTTLDLLFPDDLPPLGGPVFLLHDQARRQRIDEATLAVVRACRAQFASSPRRSRPRPPTPPEPPALRLAA